MPLLLLASFAATALCFSYVARVGVIGAVIYTAFALGYAFVLRRGKWFSPWPWVMGFWLLPLLPALVLSFRAWRRVDAAREGTILRRARERDAFRPTFVFAAVMGWLASRPPHEGHVLDDRIASAVLVGLAVAGCVALLAFDAIAFVRVRTHARRATRAVPIDDTRNREGAPVFDFGEGDETRELLEETGVGYRGMERVVAVYRGRAPTDLGRAIVWSALAAIAAVAGTLEALRQALM